MHVVLGGITVWTLYTLVSRVSVACLSTANRVRLELVYDPVMPDELYERYEQLQQQYQQPAAVRAVKRLYRRRPHGMVAAVAAAAVVQRPHQSRNVVVEPAEPACLRIFDDCTATHEPDELGKNEFPNLLPAVQCRDVPRCKKIVYPVRVLTRQQNNGGGGGGNGGSGGGGGGVGGKTYTQGQVPEDLRKQNWVSYERNVTIACYCYFN